MTSVSVRRVEWPAVADAVYTVQSYAYHARLPCPSKEEWTKGMEKTKGIVTYAVYEDDRPVCVAASAQVTQNVRGRLFPSDIVGGVATLPAARRKGYVREVMAALLAHRRKGGTVFSNLYPFRASFYGRMGYVILPETLSATFTAQALVPLLKIDLGGELELRVMGEAVDEYRAFLEAQRARTHGMTLFDYFDREKAAEEKLWVALAKFGGQAEGMMLYNMEDQPGGGQVLHADRFFTHTSRARMLLLQWIARHVDQVESVRLALLAGERPLSWLPDIGAKTSTDGFAPMGRVLDVSALGELPVGPGGFTARISDPLCPFNEGVWRFESRGGSLEVSPAGQPDCDLTIQGLTALVYGTHDPQDLPLLGWGSIPPELEAPLRAMFPMALPYLHEEF